MCGGPGSRLGAGEKPLVEVGGRPMVGRVLDALADSAIDSVYAVTSPAAPATAAWVDAPVIETPGDGYVSDLRIALADDRITTPVLTVAADLPLLTGSSIDSLLAAYDGGSLAAAVPVGRVRALGFSVDTTIRVDGVSARPAGVNVVSATGEATWLSRDPRLAANVNRPRDLVTAAWWGAGCRECPV